MFTIKHIDRLFNEFAIEAESYEVQFDNAANLVRFMTYDKPYRDGSYTGLWAGVPHDHGGPDIDTIYVMNSRGATVAKHHFDAGCLSGQGVAVPGDSSLAVAA